MTILWRRLVIFETEKSGSQPIVFIELVCINEMKNGEKNQIIEKIHSLW